MRLGVSRARRAAPAAAEAEPAVPGTPKSPGSPTHPGRSALPVPLPAAEAAELERRQGLAQHRAS